MDPRDGFLFGALAVSDRVLATVLAILALNHVCGWFAAGLALKRGRSESEGAWLGLLLGPIGLGVEWWLCRRSRPRPAQRPGLVGGDDFKAPARSDGTASAAGTHYMICGICNTPHLSSEAGCPRCRGIA